MKRTIFLLAALALTSCATAFQQIATISSPQMKLTDEGRFRYDETDVIIDYNFWAENGQVSFVITNNLDTDVYVDLSRSFLVVNGMTFDYYQNRTYSSNASSTVVSSSYYGGSNTFAVASGMASASAYGNSSSGSSFGTASGSGRTYSHARRSSSMSTVNRGVEFKEKEGVWIPAHSARQFCEFSLLEAPFRQCGFARNPSRKEDMTLSFNERNTPFAFDNVLMLVVDGADRRLVNSFYIEKLTNILREETYEEDSERDCNGSQTGGRVGILKYRSANRFYINYDFREGTDGDTDRVKAGRPASRHARSRGRRGGFGDSVYD